MTMDWPKASPNSCVSWPAQGVGRAARRKTQSPGGSGRSGNDCGFCACCDGGGRRAARRGSSTIGPVCRMSLLPVGRWTKAPFRTRTGDCVDRFATGCPTCLRARKAHMSAAICGAPDIAFAHPGYILAEQPVADIVDAPIGDDRTWQCSAAPSAAVKIRICLRLEPTRS